MLNWCQIRAMRRMAPIVESVAESALLLCLVECCEGPIDVAFGVVEVR